MTHIKIALRINRALKRWRLAAWRTASFFITIRGRILVAFLVISMIAVVLGSFATMGIRNAGTLVDKTYDQSLMSINYARAAAADFSSMRAAFARRWIATEPAIRAKLDNEVKRLSISLAEDLTIAAQRSHSQRAMQAAAKVQSSVVAWENIRQSMLDRTKINANWKTLDHHANTVDEQIDLLINYTAGDGFIYRQMAHATVAREVQLNIVGTVLALSLSALVAWLLARRIVGPVAAASRFAELIAAGKLDVVVPRGSADELGALLSSMGKMRDNIKAMMECEVAQRRSAQARLADALESSQEGVVLVDADDFIALANAQAANLFGVSSDLLKPGTPLANLQSTLEMEGSVAAGQVLMWRGDDAQATSAEEQMAAGRWLRISRSPTSDQGYIFVCSDITERKKAEKELIRHRDQLQMLVDRATQELKAKAEELKEALNKEKELNDLQRQFVSMASHELRTPLSIIDGSAQNLARNSDNITADYIILKTKKIRDAVVRMTRLMEGTLTEARLHEGKIKVEIEACDIGKVLREVCARQQEVSKDHVISCDLVDLPATIQADPGSLDQVFTNLLSNAVKYAPDAPDIEVKARKEGNHMVISVRDHGIGIDEDELHRIGERFFRAKTSTGIAGTGIGINLVKTLVEIHGGTVNVESKKGEGSTFTVRLPVARPDQSEQADRRVA